MRMLRKINLQIDQISLEFLKDARNLALIRDFMTKRKGTTPRMQNNEAPKHNETNATKPLTRNARIVVIQEGLNQVRAVDHLEKTRLEQLFKDFSAYTEDTALLVLPQIPIHIKNDFLLQKLIQDFEKKHSEYQKLEHFLRARWESCSQYPDYYEYLEKLLTKNVPRITYLHKAMQLQHHAITHRLNILSVESLELHHLVEAQNTLLTALETFTLSLSLLKFNPVTYPQAKQFKHQIVFFIEELHAQLKQCRPWINSDKANELIANLSLHLGRKRRIFWFVSDVEPVPIKYDELSPLFKELVALKTDLSPHEIQTQFLACHNLTARIESSPIQIIKKYELLYEWMNNQQNEIISKNEHLITNLNQTRTELYDLKALFIGPEFQSLILIKDAHEVTTQIDELLEYISLHFNTYHKLLVTEKINQNEASLSHLLEFAQLQDTFLNQIDLVETQVLTSQAQAKTHIQRLESSYSQERFFLVKELQKSITQARGAMEVEKKPHISLEIEAAEQLLNELNHELLKRPLSHIRTHTMDKVKQLMVFVQELKDDLKISWANHIFQLFAKKYDITPFKNNTPFSSILMQMRSYNEPYRTNQLSAGNPLQSTLDAVNQECTQLFSHLIHQFAKLDTSSGDELAHWGKRIQHLYQQAHEGLCNQQKIKDQTLAIEKRLHSASYCSCLNIVKTLEEEYLSIFQYQINKRTISSQQHSKSRDLQHANIHSHPKGKTMRVVDESSHSLDVHSKKRILLNDELSLEATTFLEQLDPRLIILFKLAQELRRINITVHLELNTEQEYLSKLLTLVMEFLDRVGKEFYAKEIPNADKFIDWLHVTAYQPLLKLYAPIVEKNHHKTPSSIAFFQLKQMDKEKKSPVSQQSFHS